GLLIDGHGYKLLGVPDVASNLEAALASEGNAAGNGYVSGYHRNRSRADRRPGGAGGRVPCLLSRGVRISGNSEAGRAARAGRRVVPGRGASDAYRRRSRAVAEEQTAHLFPC